MPLTAAERQRRYREKLKTTNPDKFEEIKKKNSERTLREYKNKTANFNEEQKEELRKKWREDRKKKENEPSTSISQQHGMKNPNQSITDFKILYKLQRRNAQKITTKRKMVSVDQLNSLLDFMKDHPNLANGLSRGRRGKLMTLKVWNTCAKRLNALQGADKDGKGWSKYWCDWKYRVRRRALELKAAKEGDIPPDSITPLSQVEETIMGIIGETTLDGVVIKSDPLADEGLNADLENEDGNEYEPLAGQYNCSRGSATRKRSRSSSKELSDLADLNGHSSPPESKPLLAEDLDVDELDNEDEANDETTQFLKLEKEKLEHSRNIQESVQLIATELTRLTDVMSQIRDVVVNRFL